MADRARHHAPCRRPSARVPRLAVVLAPLVLLAVTAAVVWPASAEPVLRTGTGVLSLALLHDRVRRVEAERDVWRWFRSSALVATAGCAVDLAGGAPLVLTAAGLVGCALLYRGLIGWNRTSTRTTDPGDWLNGISAIFAVVAVVDLALAAAGWAVPAVAGRQPVLVGAAALFVVLGTTLTVASTAALLTDLRPWLMSAGAAAALAGQVLGATGRPGWATPGAAALALSVGLAAQMPVRPTRPQPATTQSLTIGAFVVLLAGVSVLAGATRLRPDVTTPAVVWASAAVVGVSFRVVHLIRDLSHLAVRRQEALTDELTGLANRRAFDRALAVPAERRALLVLDVDRFKEVNDRFGHPAGDRLLVAVAGRLAGAVPPGAVLCRLGGDEFAVLVPDADEPAAAELGLLLLRAAADDGRRTSVSVGVATGGQLGEELFRQADTAMYQAKASRCGVRLHDADLDAAARRRAGLADDLHALWRDGEVGQLEVFHQPQVGLADGRVRGVEALVRWRHPLLGLLSPGAFLDVVEDEGLTGALTVHVLRTASRDVARWRADGWPEVSVAVNLSATDLSDPRLLPLLEDLLAAGLEASALVLEVTERALVQDGEAGLDLCHALRRRGFGLSIDDYGTGCSSLAHLSDLPATELKVDRSSTQRVLEDAGVHAIVAATVGLAHELGLRVVAEGAEDVATVDALRELGCDEVQGFVHARPMPVDDLGPWLGSWASRPDRSAAPV
ncbi:putative bifunctional diguanylate cyclase/phosphodiesterase [Kineococcus sp. DHX-1]|uniref:putative bifunctional diguanylate cyclase/phosphodiesterase n=1 Tax=Kineococcus sp. DHX-1 TaxID=3349638 RepID=UPI0036D3EF4B